MNRPDIIFDAGDIHRILACMSHEIIESNLVMPTNTIPPWTIWDRKNGYRRT
jgi:hypothetical protein